MEQPQACLSFQEAKTLIKQKPFWTRIHWHTSHSKIYSTVSHVPKSHFPPPDWKLLSKVHLQRTSTSVYSYRAGNHTPEQVLQTFITMSMSKPVGGDRPLSFAIFPCVHYYVTKEGFLVLLGFFPP